MKPNMIKNLLFISLFFTFIVGCVNNSVISTNLDKDKFSEYFSASKVAIYQSEQEIKSAHKYLSLVEGQDCQQRAHHALTDEINARTRARQQAFKLKANAVVFTDCVEFKRENLAHLNDSNEAKQCHALIICYAKAFAVSD